MQIVPFPAYYQSVYTNFDFTSFSLISCTAKPALLHTESTPFGKRLSRRGLTTLYESLLKGKEQEEKIP